MNLGNNIFNAFDIVKNTHENVNKLMEYCKAVSEDKGEYVLASPKFLRWRSNNNAWGWSISNFILLFQSGEDKELENEWRDGPIYVLEINLYDPDIYEIPMINIAKYEYADIASWSKGCSPANHWIFYHPLYSEELNYELSEDRCHYDGNVKEESYAYKKWWGLRRIVGFGVPLTDITNDNAYEIIFGGFDSLINK